MAMSAAGLKTEIKTQMAARGFNIDHPSTGGEADKYMEALATAIVNYIQANAKADDGGGTAPAEWPIL